MDALRQRWTTLKTYRRCRSLWNEYKRVCDEDDFQLVASKLTAFLDSFQVSYSDLIGFASGSRDLDTIFGDCSEVLLNLLTLVERCV